MDIKKIFSFPWYYAVVLLIVLLVFVLSIGSLVRQDVSGSVLSQDKTKMLYESLRDNSEVLELKGKVNGIQVAPGIYDVRKKQTFFTIRIFTESDRFDAVLVCDSPLEGQLINPRLMVVPPVVLQPKFILLALKSL